MDNSLRSDEITQDKKCYVYVHINKQNGKRYVGVTSKPIPENRWNHGRGYKENPYFYQAIQKHGWDGFEHVILASGLSVQQAFEEEKRLIREWNTQDREYGYNLTSGGEGSPGCIVSEETKRKHAIASMRENLSEETLRRRSEGLRGRNFSDLHKQRIGDSNSKAIEMLDTDGNVLRRFRGARDAEVELNISHSHISQCCHGHRQTTGGYMWRFAQ